MDEASIIALLDSGNLQFAAPIYESGSEILAGDTVLAFHGEEKGTVVSVVSTEAEAVKKGLDSTGVFVDIGDHSFYLGVEFLLQQPLELVSRRSAA